MNARTTVTFVVVCCLLLWSRGLADDVIVSTIWLYERLSSVIVLEASWLLSEDQTDVEHIPGASLWDLRQCTMPTSTRPRNNPDQLCLQLYARRLGIDMETPIVIYDRTNMYEAARAWWTLSMLYGREDVAVLDGGFSEWTRHRLPTETDRFRQFHNDKPGDWVAKFQPARFRDMTQMAADIRSAQRQVIDTRLPANFRGDDEEPSHNSVKALIAANKTLCRRMLRGHMLSAVNVPWPGIVDPASGRLLDCRRLRRVFQTAGVDLRKSLTTTCYLGNTACLVALAAVECGARDVAVYSGSWTEWSQLADDRLVVRTPATGKVFVEPRCPEQWSSPKAAFMDVVFPVPRNIAMNCDQ